MNVQSACRQATPLLAVSLLVDLLVDCASAVTDPEPQPVASDQAQQGCLRATGIAPHRRRPPPPSMLFQRMGFPVSCPSVLQA